MQMTTLMAEGKEELNSLLMKVKEERGKGSLKLNIKKCKKKKKMMASGHITSCQTEGGKNENSDRLYFLELQNHCGQ